ncbi:MAG: bifunctional metallophosphatase/5'-nucleotidase [Alistipes sp.]|nr:bifunctional metallophosphatase/5'-nucleotidase [Alistipes sp.]
MKKWLWSVVVVAALSAAGFYSYISTLKESEFVIISTNDMHATIDSIPHLATAVKECRDTVFTVVVDAGDRWTGDGYVDLAEGRLPIIRLMNAIGYDVATLGNHDFDAGQEVLEGALSRANFKAVCANMTANGKYLNGVNKRERITTPDGVNIDFVGVVTNYVKGHPDGNDDNFEGLHFEDPQTVAKREYLGCEGDVNVLLSHMGHDRDLELAEKYSGYDVILGGHTHKILDTLVNGAVVGQTGERLQNVGVTKVRMRGRYVVDIEYSNVSLRKYAEDPAVKKMVDDIKANPAMKVRAGSLAHATTHVGMCNLQTNIIKEATNAEIGIYHRGGVRAKKGLPAGKVTVKMLFDNEPFFSQVHTADMTTAQLRKLIIEKYNDTKNTKESHVIDLCATTPYVIVTDENDMAYDVEFPLLTEGVKYKVAVADYVARNYDHFECENEVRTPLLVYDLDLAYFKKNSPIHISNEPLQSVVVRKKE